MSVIIFEIFVVLLLVIVNGVFAMSEMAIVSARKTRLEQAARGGDRRARAALELANAPERFLSTVQIGITLVGILAGAAGGATIAREIGARLALVPALAPYAEGIGLGVVVLAITFLSLVVGELVPKRLALGNAEAIASRVARPMNLLSKIAAPFVRLLEVSTRFVLWVLRVRPAEDQPLSEEEIKMVFEQGREAGVFAAAEHDLVKNVLRLDDRRVSLLMTPRRDVVWLDVSAAPAEARKRIVNSRYSRFPLCRGAIDDVIGFVTAKRFLAECAPDDARDLTAWAEPPLFVPESLSALKALELFKNAHTHIAVVVDEHGGVQGLLTTNDVLEALVGEMRRAEEGAEPYAVRRDDGSWLLDGSLPLDEFAELFPVGTPPESERGTYHTLAGLVLTRLGRVPATADNFVWRGLRFEVVDMDGKRVDKVLVAPVAPTAPAS